MNSADVSTSIGPWRTIRRALNWFRWFWRPSDLDAAFSPDCLCHTCYEEDDED